MKRKRYKIIRQKLGFQVQGPSWSAFIEEKRAYPFVMFYLAYAVKSARGQRWWCNGCEGIFEVDLEKIVFWGDMDSLAIHVECPQCSDYHTAVTLDARALHDLMACTAKNCWIKGDGTIAAAKMRRRNREA